MKTTTCIFFNHIQFFSSTNWHCAHQRWYSHSSRHCHYQPNTSGFISFILRNSWIWHFFCGSNQRKDLSQLTSHWSIPPFSNWDIWIFTHRLMCFYMIVRMSFKAWKDQRAFIFLFGLLFFIKKFQSYCKGCKHPPL
jgi:hypothetical protein